MTDTHALFIFEPANNLLRAPFLSDQCLELLPDLLIDAGICLRVVPCHSQRGGLLWPVTSQPPVPLKCPADGRFVARQQFSNLCLAIFRFLQDVNLVSFHLGKLRVATHTCSSCFGRLEKAAMLSQLALLPTGGVALAN